MNYTIPLASNRVKKLGTTSILYTSSGNITVIGADTVLYNKANQMTLTTVGAVSSGYNYDAFGQRLKLKTGTSPFQVQIYDLSGHMLTETSQAASPVETDYVYLGDMPLAAIQPAAATISALHTDLVGTVQKATDASKTLVWACAYNAFGACTPSPATITQNLRFPGAINDATGLYHVGFRDLNKTLGQWMQPEPLGLAPWLTGGPSASVNGYPYAGNNPITNADPSGLCPNGDVMCDIAMRNAGLPQFADASEPPQQLTQGQQLASMLSLALPFADLAIGVDIAALAEAGGAETGEMCMASTHGAEAAASTFVGRTGLRPALEIQPGTNSAGQVLGRNYAGHAFDQMQGRGFVPSVVEDTIQTGVPSSDPIAARIRYYSPTNNITVVTESDGTVVTAFPGRR